MSKEEIRGTLALLKPEFAKALPANIQPEKFVRVLQTVITTTPTLLNADRNSLWAACTKCAQAGLLPDGREAALVPFKDKSGSYKVQFMPMISGILKLVRNSGELQTITSQVVFKNDAFKYWIDSDGEHIEHTPNMFSDRGEAIGAYALAKTKDGGLYIEVMPYDQIMAVKNSSRSANSGPWSGSFEHEMWRKTVMRRLSKRLPMSTDIEQVIRADDEQFESIATETTEVKELPKPADKKPRRLKTEIEAPKAVEAIEVTEKNSPEEIIEVHENADGQMVGTALVENFFKDLEAKN